MYGFVLATIVLKHFHISQLASLIIVRTVNYTFNNSDCSMVLKLIRKIHRVLDDKCWKLEIYLQSGGGGGRGVVPIEFDDIQYNSTCNFCLCWASLKLRCGSPKESLLLEKLTHKPWFVCFFFGGGGNSTTLFSLTRSKFTGIKLDSHSNWETIWNYSIGNVLLGSSLFNGISIYVVSICNSSKWTENMSQRKS